jgi:hypothetical protein
MPPGWRDDAAQAAQERDRFEHQVGATVGPGALESVRDPAVGGPTQALVGERRARAVAAQTIERLAVVVGDNDARVQGEAVAPGTQAVATAHAATGGGR